ncbi:MAG: hypothetical protein AAGA12_05075 [Pseudomonadota bacterium]
MKKPALVLILLCAACGSETATKRIPFSLDEGGIQLSDRPLRIDFGRTDHSAISAMGKLMSQPGKIGPGCNGFNERFWPDGTRLFFDDANFIGWERLGQSAGIVCA